MHSGINTKAAPAFHTKQRALCCGHCSVLAVGRADAGSCHHDACGLLHVRCTAHRGSEAAGTNLAAPGRWQMDADSVQAYRLPSPHGSRSEEAGKPIIKRLPITMRPNKHLRVRHASSLPNAPPAAGCLHPPAAPFLLPCPDPAISTSAKSSRRSARSKQKVMLPRHTAVLKSSMITNRQSADNSR